METAKREERLLSKAGDREHFMGDVDSAHTHGQPMEAAEHGNPAATGGLSVRSSPMSRGTPEIRWQQLGTMLLRGPREIPTLPNSPVVRYPILEALLAQKGLELKAIWTLRDVAAIFGVSVRTIQSWVQEKKLLARDLPGRGRFGQASGIRAGYRMAHIVES